MEPGRRIRRDPRYVPLARVITNDPSLPTAAERRRPFRLPYSARPAGTFIRDSQASEGRGISSSAHLTPATRSRAEATDSVET